MSDTKNESSGPPPVRDKRVPPSGVLPKNTQALVLTGIALLMVCVIALSGRNTPKERNAPAVSGAAPVDPSAARIQEYKNRIEEEAHRLQLEKADLARTQESLASSAASAYGGPTGSVGPYAPPESMRYPVPGSEDSFETDKRKREYQSLFASNVALSYRKEAAAMTAPAAPTPESLAKMLAAYPSLASLAATPEVAPKPAPGAEPAKAEPNLSGAKERATERDAEIDRADGKAYRLFEGTVLETVLTNRLDGSFSGPVNCMVTTTAYSHNGRHLLIPQGSRVLGEVRKVDVFGQERLAVAFHRLIMPDGYSVSLDKFQGLNQIGETGLRDQVNHHYLQVFGVSLAIGAIAGLSQANTRYGIDESAADAYRQGVATSLSQSSLRILDRYLNVLPTFTIREGHRVKIYLSDDLLLPDYEKHKMADDI